MSTFSTPAKMICPKITCFTNKVYGLLGLGPYDFSPWGLQKKLGCRTAASASARGILAAPSSSVSAQSPGRITPVTIVLSVIGSDPSSPTKACATLPSILSPTSRIASILPASAAFNSALATRLRALWSSPASAISIRSASRKGLSLCCPLGLAICSPKLLVMLLICNSFDVGYPLALSNSASHRSRGGYWA